MGIHSRQLKTPVQSSGRLPLTDLAQASWKEWLEPGDWAIDATAGNGLDTAFLAACVRPGGRVFAFDIQEAAIRSTATLLESKGLLESVTLIRASHARMRDPLACGIRGQVKLVCFNLGYLPNGDHAIRTTAASTLPALYESLLMLSPAGALSVVAYRGHDGAMAEAQAVEAFFNNLPPPWRLLRHVATGSAERPGPVWWLAGADPSPMA